MGLPVMKWDFEHGNLHTATACMGCFYHVVHEYKHHEGPHDGAFRLGLLGEY